MLTTYDRLMRQYRLEAKLSYRESDRRDMTEVFSWTRDYSNDSKTWCQPCGAYMGPLDPKAPWHRHKRAEVLTWAQAQERRAAVKATFRDMEGM